MFESGKDNKLGTWYQKGKSQDLEATGLPP